MAFLAFLAFISRGFNYGFNAPKLESSMQIPAGSFTFDKRKDNENFSFKGIPFAIKTYLNKTKSKLDYNIVSSIYNYKQQSVTITIDITNNGNLEQIPILNLQFLDSSFNLIKTYDIADPNISLKAGRSKLTTIIVPNLVLSPSKVYVFFRNKSE